MEKNQCRPSGGNNKLSQKNGCEETFTFKAKNVCGF